MDTIVSASILSADICHLGDDLDRIKASGCDHVHFDVMDGVFVPNISFGIPVLASVRRHTDMFIDAHLMITDPIKYIGVFADNGADMISFHLESQSDPAVTINEIKSRGKKAGIAIKPATPVSEVLPYVKSADMVLVMTVEPGFGGQGFIPECMDKIKAVRAEIQKNGYKCELEIDGGAKLNNTADIVAAGADVIVAGSAVFGGDIAANVKGFHEVFKEGAAKAAWSK